MIKQDNTEHNVVDYDDVIVRVTHYVDDGCDWTARIIHRMNRLYFIRMGRCPPIPPAPQVVQPRLIPKTKKRKTRKVRKVNDDE